MKLCDYIKFIMKLSWLFKQINYTGWRLNYFFKRNSVSYVVLDADFGWKKFLKKEFHHVTVLRKMCDVHFMGEGI